MSRYKIQLIPEPTHFTLKIQNEENIWSNNFENNYIEQMTSRTGNYKSYQTFIKMLTNVINTSKNNKPIKSLSYKIMTLSDLSQFRGVEKNNKRISSEQDEAKRYFLLTYQTPYEKVHYPLPLIAYEDNTKIFDKTNALNGSHFYKNKDFDLDSHGDYEKESMCSRLSELSTKDSRHNSTLRSDVLRNHRKRSNSRNQIGRRRPSLEKVTNNGKENDSEKTNTNSQLLQNSNYENIIQDQKKRILQLEIELKKKNSRIRELKHDNETLKSDKKLLKVKNNTLLMEISSYKNGRLSLVDHFDRNKKQIRERGRSLTRRSASRNSEVQYLNSREPSPVKSTQSIPIRYNRTSLLRSRSYERPWATNMKGTPRDSSLTRRPRTHSEDRHDKRRPATGHQNKRTDVRAYNFDRYRSYSRPTSRTRNQHQDEFNERPYSRTSSRAGSTRSATRFDPTLYVEQKNAKIRQQQIKNRSKIREKMRSNGNSWNNGPVRRFYDDDFCTPEKPIKRNFVAENASRNVFESTIDVDMANIDKRLNALQDFIKDLE